MTEEGQRQAGAENRRLLLVVCNQNFRSTLRRILCRCGYQIDCAASGEEALNHLATQRYGAVISDVHLPGQVCGITLMQQVRSAGREVPIIFLTEEETVRIRSALEAGNGVRCLQLPLDVDRLKQMIASCCPGGVEHSDS